MTAFDVGGWDGIDAWELDEELALEEQLGEDLASGDDVSDLGEVLREALHEDYADATSEEMEAAMADVLESMSPAESFGFAKALGQIERGAARALTDPALARIATTALPVAGTAVGTAFGGPAGAALGGNLGGVAAKALSAPTRTRAAMPAAPTTPMSTLPPSIAGGSPAAAKALVLTQQPEVLKSLLALALGQHGRKSVGGVEVGSVMNLLSNVFGQVAADADELMRASEDAPSYLVDGGGQYRIDPVSPADRADALYEALLLAENEDLEEAVGGW
jgi:hypothetical protein